GSAMARLSFSLSALKKMSAAVPGASHSGAFEFSGRTARARPSATASSASVGEIKVATRVMPDQTRAVLIAGPTASGKSALALAVAEQLDGVIINADSMQVYRDLRILTARPSPDEEARVPHRLYGHVDTALNYSVGRYITEAADALAHTERDNKLPIFVGGTGLYFKALTRGLAAMPPIPAPVRHAVREWLAAEGPEALHAELAQADAVSAER